MGNKRSTPEKRTLILWALLARDGAAAFQKELKPEPDKGDRDTLKEEELITWEKRGQRIWIEVTDKGWAWAEANLDATLPATSVAGSQILRAWLGRLKAFLEARNLALADVLAPQPSAKTGGEPEAELPAHASYDYATARDRIRQAYLEISGGRFNTRVLLRELRSKLHDIDRSTLDPMLNRMQRDRQASLYQLDNRAEVTDADRDAAIYFGDEPRHILWIER